MTFKLGLTGSIGMGKSTTARIFADQGCGIWDADAAVHKLYGENGAAVAPLAAIFPQVLKKRAICRTAIKQLISDNSEALKQIENIVHPLVIRDRQLFIEQAKQAVLVFDIPLLYETHSQHQFDAVACVYISPEEQRRRVMDRGTMTAAQLDYILSKQMPIAKKRELSHYQIKTDSLVHVMAQVSVILADIREQVVDA
ncbi:dephospho-CoA kinase [Paracoccaceae bacterium]|nr:dephospho-CoA kinase [Paracoccaceae bacterium]